MKGWSNLARTLSAGPALPLRFLEAASIVRCGQTHFRGIHGLRPDSGNPAEFPLTESPCPAHSYGQPPSPDFFEDVDQPAGVLGGQFRQRFLPLPEEKQYFTHDILRPPLPRVNGLV